MFTPISRAAALTIAATALLASAQQAPTSVLSVNTRSIPVARTQQVRILRAVLPPGGRSTWHTHDSPPFVYVIRGAFTLDIRGQPSVLVKAGTARMEPVGTVIRGRNASRTTPLELIIFQVATPGAPFLHDSADQHTH